MKKFMMQLFRSVVTLVILVVMALMIFDLRAQLNDAKRELAAANRRLAELQAAAPAPAAAPQPAAHETDGHDAGL